MKYRLKINNALIAIFCFTASFAASQSVIRFSAINQRPSIIETHFNNWILSKISDTLTLPFFEDFSQPSGYPSSDRWTDNQVWINNSFPKKAPNYGVATFDHLNSHGKPYHTLNIREMVYADSLTSQPINIQFRKAGISTINYKPDDSIYISFFVQKQGIGDAPEAEDSLILYFKNSAGKWIRQWSLGGGSVGNFKEYFIPIANYNHLIQDFQFRFVNFTKATGNLNHWHVDYIRIDKNRRAFENSIQDVGISTVEDGLFMDFKNVPFSHYKLNRSILRGMGPALQVRNLNLGLAVQTRFQLSIYNRYNQKVYNKPFSASSRNLNANGDTTEHYESLFFDSFTTATPKIKFVYSVDPQSNDNTPDAYDSKTNNNQVVETHEIMPWYAYDDGSAEGGFGLDYAYLGNLKGQFAIDFTTFKDDSLRGLAIYFNQSLTDVSARNFKLRIWSAISPVGKPDNQDKLIYEMSIDKPIYTDSVNGYAYLFFDSTLFLPKGKYFVGWIQQMPYVLNVGYDNNYRYKNIDQTNPHLYSNLLGSWEYAGREAKGTPMIRMLFGERFEYAFTTPKIKKPTLVLYPNPCNDYIHLNGINTEDSKIEIWDVAGKLNIQSQFVQRIFVGDLKPGHYIIRCIAKNNQITFNHFVKS